MAQGKTPREQLGVDLPDPTRPEQIEELQVEEQGPQRPEWLPEKFKDEAEFASSYRSLEDELRRRAEEQNRMSAQLEQLTEMVEESRTQQVQQPPQNEQQLREQLQVAYENDPIGTMAYLAQQYATQTIEQRFAEMQSTNRPALQQQAEQQNQLMAMTVDRALGDKYDDWGKYKDKVASEIERDPALLAQEYLTSPDLTMRQLERIYENVKARDVLEAAQAGNFVTNELRGMKERSQTLSGSGQRPGEKTDDEEHIERLMAAARGMSYSAWREST